MFLRYEPTCEIQEIKEHFQTANGSLLCQIGSCDPPAQFQVRKTDNAEWYVNICLPKVFEAWTVRRPNNGTQGLLLHHDNAWLTPPPPLWTTWKQIAFSWSPRPRIPGVSFFLFPQVKRQFKGKQILGIKNAQAVLEGVISDVPCSTWSEAMVRLFERMTKCVHVEGVTLKN